MPLLNKVSFGCPALNKVSLGVPLLNKVSLGWPILNKVSLGWPVLNKVSLGCPLLNNVKYGEKKIISTDLCLSLCPLSRDCIGEYSKNNKSFRDTKGAIRSCKL
jgi:hypothetical protein